jgi:hypothetical protein
MDTGRECGSSSAVPSPEIPHPKQPHSKQAEKHPAGCLGCETAICKRGLYVDSTNVVASLASDVVGLETDDSIYDAVG